MTVKLHPLAVLLAAALSIAPIGCMARGHVIVVRRGWHTDVGFMTEELGESLKFVTAVLPGSRYVFFGFGDKRYLEARHHRTSSLAAALWPGSGLLLVTELDDTPQQAFGGQHVADIALTDEESAALQRFVVDSFATVGTPNHASKPTAYAGEPTAYVGGPTAYAGGPYPGSAYFIASSRYSALHTCNTWAAEALHAAKPRVHHVGVVFAGQLWPQVKRLAR